jgi:UDP-N-acetyl-D-mannosaminuronic acid dehydrogenase
VQIAFANEVALICEGVGANVWAVRELVNKSPHRQMHLPGAGVGGHCIPKDPWLLAYGVNDQDIPVRLVPQARQINDGMPLHMADLVRRALDCTGCEIDGARILVMGYAYLEDSDDTRNSPSETLVRRLTEMGAQVTIHDPYVAKYSGDLLEAAKGCDAAVVMVRHREYLRLDPGALRAVLRRPILVDGRAAYTPGQARKAGLEYWGVGIAEGRTCE